MKLKEAHWGWNGRLQWRKGDGKIVVAHLSDFSWKRDDDFDPLAGCTVRGGGYFDEIEDAEGRDAQLAALAEFNAAVVRDGVDPRRAHKEFLKIDEYREALAPDVPARVPAACRAQSQCADRPAVTHWPFAGRPME